MTLYKTLVHALMKSSQTSRGIIFIGNNMDMPLTYGKLYEDAQHILYNLQEKGVNNGDLLVFQIEEQRSFLFIFWACLLGGIIPVPVTVGATAEHRLKVMGIWEISDRPFIITTKELAQQFNKQAEQDVDAENLQYREMCDQLLDMEELLIQRSKGRIHPSLPEDIALIQYSSGSTGNPKGVILTHRNLLCNIDAIINGSQLLPEDALLSWMPLTHDMGLIGFHLTPLVCGINQYLMPPALFLLKPQMWLQKTNDYRITQISSPNFGYKHFLNHFKPKYAEAWDLSSVRLVVNGAEPISLEIANEFLITMEPYGLNRKTMFPVYGMAEASLAVTFPPMHEELQAVYLDRSQAVFGAKVQELGEETTDSISFVDVGYPVKNCQICICDAADNPMDDYCIGNILIKGDNVTGGYYKNPEATHQTFTAEGWLKTGDLGFIRNGRLVITGRKKDIVFVNGQNYYPHDLEAVALGSTGIEFGKIAICGIRNQRAGKDDIVAFIQNRGRLDAFIFVALALKKHLLQRVGLELTAVVPVRQIPKTTSGKPQRYKLGERFTLGEFNPIVAEMNNLMLERVGLQEQEKPEGTLENQLIVLWREVFRMKEEQSIGVTDSFFEYGGDSLTAARLASRIHQQFEVELQPSMLYELSTIRRLAAYLEQADKKTYIAIPKIEQAIYYPVSSSQKRIYLQEQFSEMNTAYNMPFAVRVDGAIDKQRLEKAFNELIVRHESLRTSYLTIDGQIKQQVHTELTISITQLTAEDQEFKALLVDLIQPYELHDLPLMRVFLIQLEQQSNLLLIDMHHVSSDGISANLILDELFQLYAGIGLPEQRLQYRDYAAWQFESLQSPHIRLLEDYWLNRLKGDIPLLNMPYDCKRTGQRTYQGDTVSFTLPVQLLQQLRGFMEQYNMTLYTCLFSLFSVFLFKYTQQKEIIVGSLVSGRSHMELENMIGAFVNYLPIRCELDSNMTFLQHAKATQVNLQADFLHQEYPFDQLVSLLEVQTDASRNPIFDTMVILHNQTDFSAAFSIPELKISHVHVPSHTSKLDFKLDFYMPSPNELLGVWEFNTQLLHKATVERFGPQFIRVVEQAFANPDISLSEIEIIKLEDQVKLLETFNPAFVPFPEDCMVHHWVEQQAKLKPNQLAVIYKDQRLSYRRLNEKANALARVLLANGLKPDQIIGITVERSPEMIIGILAILKAGGAYMPITADIPPERVRYMLDDSQTKILLGQQLLLERLSFQGLKLCLNEASLYEGEGTDLPLISQPHHLAYVIYTSGSTGNPKGVMIEHRSVVNRIHWMQKNYPLTARDVILQKTSFAFDVSVWELFWWSMAGAAVCFLAPGEEKEPEAIVKAINSNQVTTLHFVPSMLHLFLTYLENTPQQTVALASLCYVFASGEALQVQQVERFNEILNNRFGSKLVNLYGPTEATVDVTYYNCSMGLTLDSVPIGKPIDNIRLYVLDSSFHLQPIGVPGELFISGVGLARGYLNRPELTSERFAANPFIPGERMYKSGDLVKWRADGNIEYLGRLDTQVKIRGYRIELGEIEQQLLQYESIVEAVVIAQEDEQGNTDLCAYMVATSELKLAHLKTFLAMQLPAYMVPAFYQQLAQIPLSANGKVNRSLLAKIEERVTLIAEYVAPYNKIQADLVEIWQEILKVERVGISDSFLELGGHSLKAAQITAQIQQVFQVNMPIGELFKRQTVLELAEWIEAAEFHVYEPIPAAEHGKYYRLSSAQARLYLLDKLEGIGTAYNIPFAMMLTGKINTDQIRAVFQIIMDRHESLRSSFDWVDGAPVQIIHDNVELIVDCVTTEIDGLDGVLHNFVRPFNLSIAPLFRVGLISISSDQHVVVCDMHHIISDGVSIVLLMDEFVKLYENTRLPELKLQYKDYAVWQLDRLSSNRLKMQEQYWLQVLAGPIPALDLPLDVKRLSTPSFAGKRIELPLGQKLSNQLEIYAKQSNTTVYFVLLAVFNVVLAKYSGQEDIIIGSPVAGRQHADLQSAIGMFVNTLAMRNQPNAAKSFKQFLHEVTQNGLQALDNQDYPFEELVRKLNLSRDLSRNPLFDTLFILQNIGIREQDKLEEAVITRYPFPSTSSKFDLTLETTESQDGFSCGFEFRTSLFHMETIERLSRHYVHMLEQVIEQPKTILADLQLITWEEQLQLLQFNPTPVNFPRECRLHQWVEQQAAEHPFQEAVLFEQQTLTYGELNGRANFLATVLKANGVKSDQIVGIAIERSLEMIVGILAILKAGGAYLPLVTELPQERILYMLEDSQAKIVIGRRNWIDELPFGGIKLILDEEVMYEGNHADLQALVEPNHLAYVIYTSGSTGNPKGVMIEHHSVINRINWMQKTYPLTESDVILQKTSFAFDVSVWELFWWSMAGAKVHFLAPGAEKDPEAIVDAIRQSGVTTLHFVPSMLHLFLDYLEKNPQKIALLATLRYVFASGEALQVQQVERFNSLLSAQFKTELINLYGPTEATVDVSYYNCSTNKTSDLVPIGKPIDNTGLYVLGAGNQLQPIGITGELFITGVGLARGYLNQPKLTEERFVVNPFIPGERMYRSGDLAKWLPDGNIAYLGRADNQVKLRGYRIELGEIEHQLLEIEGIDEASVLCKEDAMGNRYLLAFLVAKAEMSPHQLRLRLSGQLPEYMIPARFVFITEMPLSSNGKIDRKLLMNQNQVASIQIQAETSYTEPQNELESKLAAYWCKLLDAERVGIHDNFFEIGGHSLLLLSLHAALETEFPGVIKLTDLFAYPTISKLAAFIIQFEQGAINERYPFIELTNDYLIDQARADNQAVFKLQLEFDSSHNDQLSALLLLSAAYLFGRINKQAIFTLAHSNGINSLQMLNVDLSGELELAVLLTRLENLLQSSSSINGNQLHKNLETNGKATLEILPLLYKRESIPLKAAILELFEIQISYYQEGESLYLLMEYEARRLKKTKMKELFGQYVQIVRMVIRQYLKASKHESAEKGGITA